MARHLVVLLCAAACAVLFLAASVRGDCFEFKTGQKWQTGPPDTCAEYTCNGDGTVTGKTCSPVYAPNSKCKVRKVATDAKFPACCPTIDCPP